MNRYTIAVREPNARRIEVVLEAEVRGAQSLDLRLPVWTPGSYLIREHSRHVDVVSAHAVRPVAPADPSTPSEPDPERGEQGGEARALSLQKIDKQTWRIDTHGASLVRVSYRLHCIDLSVRTNHVDPTHAFINPAAACAFISGRENEPCEVRLEMPAGWRSFVALPEREGAFFAHDYDELADSPFEFGPAAAHQLYEFDAAGAPHRLVVWGRGDFDPEKVVNDIIKIIEAEAAWFDGLPFREPYLFILHLTDKGRGGLEHRRSCALIVQRFSFVQKSAYEDFLQLVAHEYFHLWNVKRLRPRAFTPYDWTRENHTALLWAMEGLTSTYEVMALRRAGLVSSERFLETWAERLTQLLRTPGRLRTTLEQASYDAWIKHYRPDETTTNSTVSYYLKGSAVGFLLDLELRRRSLGERSLDDLMRLLFQRHGEAPGLPERGVETAALELVPESERAGLQAWFERALRSTQDLEWDSALAGVGLRAIVHAASGSEDKGSAEREPAEAPAAGGNARSLLGARFSERSGALEVMAVTEGGPAQAAGICPGDEIVAVDGFRAEMRPRISRAAPGEAIRLSIFRFDELIELKCTLGPAAVDTITIVPIEEATPVQLALRLAWLGEAWPARDAGRDAARDLPRDSPRDAPVTSPS